MQGRTQDFPKGGSNGIGLRCFVSRTMFINRLESKAYNSVSGQVNTNAVGIATVCDYVLAR